MYNVLEIHSGSTSIFQVGMDRKYDEKYNVLEIYYGSTSTFQVGMATVLQMKYF